MEKTTTKFEVGDEVICLNDQPLNGKDVNPPLEEGLDYKVKGITVDSGGYQHLDVGLKSNYNWIKSYETGEELPDGDQIHWCHPSRFQKK